MLQFVHGVLTPEIFATLTKSVGWEVPPPDQIRAALENSLLTLTAFEDGAPVGMARLCGDGFLTYYLEDVAILPDYQGRHIGKRMIEEVLAFIRGREHNGWKVRLELISANGKEQFYEHMGFERLPCEEDGAGMFLTVEKQPQTATE